MTMEELQVLITANTENLRSEITKAQKDINKLSDVANKTSTTVSKGFNFIKASIIGAGIGLLIHEISGAMDDAITRLDTMKNYSNVMSNLGIGSEESQASINRLTEALKGLPTTLDSAALSVQRFTSANGNIKASTEMFLALNNAILAGGAPAQMQATAIEQLSQAYAKGKPDMMEWRSAMAAMPAQLAQVANVMGYVNADALGEALRSGAVSMDEFMVTLTKMNKEGLNGFKSLDEQARNATGGIETSIINVKTAIARGLADIMDAIGRSNIAGFFDGIRDAIDKVVPYIVAFIKLIATAVNAVSSLFGKKTKKETDDTKKSVGGLGASISNTASDMDNATGSAKKLKKELNGLAAFDEMNVLKENNASSSGGSSGGSGVAGGSLGDIDLSAFDDLEDKTKKSDEIFEKMKAHLKEFYDLLNSMGFDGIVSHIQNIGKSLKDIFTNSNVQSSAQNWLNTVIGTLKTAGLSVIQIGINITDGFLGSIDGYLAQNKDRITNFLVSIFDIGSHYNEITGQFWDALADISSVFKSPEAEQIGADIIAMFANPLMSAVDIIVKFADDINTLFAKPIIDNAEKIKVAMENTFSAIQPFFDTLAEAATYIGDSLNTLYDEHLHPFFESLTQGLSDTFGKFLDVYNEYIAPFIQRASEKFSELWDKHLKPLWDKITDFLGDVFDNLKALYENILKPVIDWIVQNVLPVLIPIIETIYNVIVSVLGVIFDLIGSVIDILKGVMDFIVGVFTGDWDKAWKGIKGIFEGIWNAIKSVVMTVIDVIKTIITTAFNVIKNVITTVMNTIKSVISSIWNAIWNIIKGVINGIIGGVEKMVNTIIKGLNLILKPLRDVGNSILSALGIKGFSFKAISEVKLPRLAQGGIVDKPTIAQIGEDGKEAVMPLERNTGWIDELAEKLNTKGNGQPVHVIFNLGDEKLVDKVVDGINDKMFEQNGEMVFNL